MVQDPSRRRRWLQISLRTMHVWLFLVACVAAVYVHTQRRGDRLERRMYHELTTERHFSTDGLSIDVVGVNGGKLIQPTIVSKQRGETSTIIADAAWITDVANDGRSVTMCCRNAIFGLGDTEAKANRVFKCTLPTCGE